MYQDLVVEEVHAHQRVQAVQVVPFEVKYQHQQQIFHQFALKTDQSRQLLMGDLV